ncbi:MAG: hypothetical protein IJN17_07205 [Clostridia bacterium]|nr:hypothetical protein [Clostridia bacterium]
MKRSLLSLLLALVMCLSIFCVSCSSDKEEDKTVKEEDAEITPMTITLYAPTNGTTTQEQVDLVQEKFNEITESKYNTHVILKLIPDDQYEATIEQTLDRIHTRIAEEESREESRALAEKEARERGETLAPETEEETEPEEKDDSPEISYPKEREDQLDIFLVRSFEDYYKLATSEHADLSPLDQEISGSAKLLSSYMYPYLIRAAKVQGYTYGIFNNTVFGDYQYLLLNKELVDKYEYDPELMKDVASISLFLREVKQNEPDVIPFLGNLEAPVVYWNDQPSVIGAFVGNAFSSSGRVDATTYRPDALYPGSLFNSSAFRAWMLEYNKLYQADIFVEKTEENANSKFAATVIEGDVTLSPTYADVYGNYKVDEYGFKYITDPETGVDYYVSVYKRPVADNNNVFGAGYVVSAYTEDVTRCMEIITCLNTDASLANLFMYGVQGTHYSINETDGLVHKMTDTYSMDINTMGNMYLLTPSDDMNEYWQFMSKNNWENAKNTNREAVMSPFLSFYFNPERPAEEDLSETQVYTEMTFDEIYAEAVKLSAPLLEDIFTYRDDPTVPDMTMERKLLAYRTLVSEDPIFDHLTDYNKGVYYMLSPYNDWYQEHYGVTLGLG